MNSGDNRAFSRDAISQVDDGAKHHRSLRDEIEAVLRRDFLHIIKTDIPTWIRPVIREEIERAISIVAPEKWRAASLQTGIESPAREFQLQFTTNPAAKRFTLDNILDEHGDALQVILIDAKTKQCVNTGPESSVKLEVVPLVGDFNHSEEQEWTVKEFEKHVAKERDNKGQLLTGDLEVHLKEGVGTVGLMHFTDNSSFVRTKQFRLGIRVAEGNDYPPLNIREGKSQAFSVIDRRGKSYQKRDTPAPADKVWRLINIGKGGPYHRKLEQKGIHTVEEFCVCHAERAELLRDMLGKMSDDVYEATINHAKKCGITVQRHTRDIDRPLEQPANWLHDRNYPPTCLQAASVIWSDEDWGVTSVAAFSANESATAEQGGPIMSTVFGSGAVAPANGWPVNHDMVEPAITQEAADVTQAGADGITVSDFDIGELIVWPQDAQKGNVENSSPPSCNGEPSTGGQQLHWRIDSRNQDPAADATLAHPSREGGDQWWLRIGMVIRCAALIRFAKQSAERQLPPRKHLKLCAMPQHRIHTIGWCPSQMSARTHNPGAH